MYKLTGGGFCFFQSKTALGQSDIVLARSLETDPFLIPHRLGEMNQAGLTPKWSISWAGQGRHNLPLKVSLLLLGLQQLFHLQVITGLPPPDSGPELSYHHLDEQLALLGKVLLFAMQYYLIDEWILSRLKLLIFPSFCVRY